MRQAVGVWSEAGAFEFNIIAPEQRADSTTTVRANEGFDPAVLQDFCRDTCGVTIGPGIGALRGQAFRIAHMGHVNAPMIFGALGAVELGLNTLNIPHGSGGLQAAVTWLGSALRQGDA